MVDNYDNDNSLSELLLSSDASSEALKLDGLWTPRKGQRWLTPSYILRSVVCVSLIVNFGLAVAYSRAVSNPQATVTGQEIGRTKLYSPAQDAVRYKLSSHREHTDFQGPRTPYNDKLWLDLYAHFNVYITEEEAQLLPNKTAPAAKGNFYPIVLNVFHELHCLDSIRKVFYYFLEPHWNATHNPYVQFDGDVYAALMQFGTTSKGIEHIDHCIDTIRQTMVCNADITPLVTQWSDETHDFRSRATVVHECRDFDKIVEWADSRQYELPLGGWGDGPEVGKCSFSDPTSCLYG